MLTSLLTLFLVGLVALVVISVVLAIVGAVFGLAFGLIGILLFKVLPILLVGYVMLRLLAPKRRRSRKLIRSGWKADPSPGDRRGVGRSSVLRPNSRRHGVFSGNRRRLDRGGHASAICRNACPAGESGEESAVGAPTSPDSRTLISSGTSPR
jgi:hypothetical protein